MNQNRYPQPSTPNQPPQAAEQAPAPLTEKEKAALYARIQQRLRQAAADPHGGHALKPGEVLPAGFQDAYGNNQQVVGRFLGWTTNEKAQNVPVFERFVAPPQSQQLPRPAQNPYSQAASRHTQAGNQHPQRPTAPQPPQPQQQLPVQDRYPLQPYQGQGQYHASTGQLPPQPPMFPGRQAPQPIAPPRTERPSQPTQGFDVAASWTEVTPDQVPKGVQFGPEQTDAATIGLGPNYQSYFPGQRGINVHELGGAETHVEALGGVIGQTGEHGDDRFATPEMREDDIEAYRAQVAAEEAARVQQQPPQTPDQQQ